jgi:hypothetical protein
MWTLKWSVILKNGIRIFIVWKRYSGISCEFYFRLINVKSDFATQDDEDRYYMKTQNYVSSLFIWKSF